MPGSLMSTSLSSNDESFNSSVSTSTEAEIAHFTALIKTEGEMCYGCGGLITDRYLLKVNGHAWHAECLRCCVCHVNLDMATSCFTKEDSIYCKHDYNREFSTKCAKCMRPIQPTDWVRRAKHNVYHLACFACDSCKRQLSTGEEFALQDNKVLCKAHYIETIEGGPHSDDSCSQKQKAKRVRTTFTEEQIQVLQANFQLDSNPDGQDLERIAQITGLSKRVTQVWFQNSRARQKKHQQNKINNGDVKMSMSGMMSTSGSCMDDRQCSPPLNNNTMNNHFNNSMCNELALGPLSVSLTSSSSAPTPPSPDMAESSWLVNPVTPCSDPSGFTVTFMS